MQNSLKTSISRGKFKGKSIILPSLSSTRSTKSIVRESFFNTVGSEIIGKIFIEAFGGSGLMAAEALSSGSAKSYIIELDKDAFSIATKNAQSLQSKDIVAYNSDTFKTTPLLCREFENILLYLDPPFSVREGRSDIYEQVWKMVGKIDAKKLFLVVLEHMSSYVCVDTCGELVKFKSRKFGNTTLSYYKNKNMIL